MSERQVILDEPLVDEESVALRNAIERAERAEAQLEKMKRAGAPAAHGTSEAQDSEPAGIQTEQSDPGARGGHAAQDPKVKGIEALRHDSMMVHLLDSLDAGKDIGHYGRLVFAMVARHFLSDDEVIAELTKDPDFAADQAVGMLRQVEGRDYNPPRRERILEWQAEQEFQILPDANDPDCGNVYRTLRFPTETYHHIEEYQEEKAGVV